MVYSLFWTKNFHVNWNISIFLENTALFLVNRDVYILQNTGL